MKKGILVSLVVLMIGFCFGDLLQDLDQMSPTQAAAFQSKLEKKLIKSVGADIVGFGGLQAVNLKTLETAFPGTARVDYLYSGGASMLFPVNDTFSTGFKMNGGFNFTMNESSSKVYEDMCVGFGSVQFVLDYKFVKTESFIFKADAGLGGLIGGYNYHKTDENTKTSFDTFRYGLGLSYSLGMDCLWLVKEYYVGLGLSYFNGKVTESQRLWGKKDAAAPELDFSGLALKFTVGMYL
ncbi:MAG: hypothetical protein A2Y40_01595 [Candidatus Margulisbacteria bacterium GWF2_35_9]|nr:MAG: hypothetical protein A2Y40_01595 [Candidatus Margulisbacteria bacterium GWF2_35_9]